MNQFIKYFPIVLIDGDIIKSMLRLYWLEWFSFTI